jgi:hypothetical protein
MVRSIAKPGITIALLANFLTQSSVIVIIIVEFPPISSLLANINTINNCLLCGVFPALTGGGALGIICRSDGILVIAVIIFTIPCIILTVLFTQCVIRRKVDRTVLPQTMAQGLWKLCARLRAAAAVRPVKSGTAIDTLIVKRRRSRIGAIAI